jgi:hypothetical protein
MGEDAPELRVLCEALPKCNGGSKNSEFFVLYSERSVAILPPFSINNYRTIFMLSPATAADKGHIHAIHDAHRSE